MQSLSAVVVECTPPGTEEEESAASVSNGCVSGSNGEENELATQNGGAKKESEEEEEEEDMEVDGELKIDCGDSGNWLIITSNKLLEELSVSAKCVCACVYPLHQFRCNSETSILLNVYVYNPIETSRDYVCVCVRVCDTELLASSRKKRKEAPRISPSSQGKLEHQLISYVELNVCCFFFSLYHFSPIKCIIISSPSLIVHCCTVCTI